MNKGSYAAIGNGGKKYTLTFEYVCDTFFYVPTSCTDIYMYNRARDIYFV